MTEPLPSSHYPPSSRRRNPDAWSDALPGNGHPGPAPYTFTQPVHADPELVRSLAAEAGQIMGPANVVRGLNATADSFYSSQVCGDAMGSQEGLGGSRGGGWEGRAAPTARRRVSSDA